MLKLADNPPMLGLDEAPLDQWLGTWWVAHTKSRFEKAFAWDLRGAGVPYYLPLYQRLTVSGGRKRKVLAPLFPGYVFFCGSADDRYTAMTTNRLCQTIDVPDQAQLRQELADLQKALEAKAGIDPYPHAAVGRRCRVRCGPFQGLEGVVIQRNGVARLVLEVSILGQGAALEVDTDLVDPADED